MKNSEWQNALYHVKSLRDKLGHKIDKEIEETIAIMHLMEVNTTMSCGGHLDRDTGGPYVVFAHIDASQYKKICNEINNPSLKEFKNAAAEAKRLTFLEREKIWRYLKSFYKNRSVTYDYQLVIEVRPFSNNLFCQGMVNAPFKDPIERKALLLASQREMMQFTEYLKSVYFKAKNEKPLPSSAREGGG